MPIQRPIMVVSRNHLCGQVERLTNMVDQWSRNFTQRWKIAQTWKELDPEHEVQLVLRGSSHRTDKTAFFFGWSIGLDQLFGGVTPFHPAINRAINSGHSPTPLPQYLYTCICRCGI